MLQDAYVHVAEKQLLISGRQPTAEAIAVMTEINMDNVVSLMSSDDDATLRDAEMNMNAAIRVLLGWHTDREYIGPYGLVRDLPFVGASTVAKKDIRDFTDLAQRYSPGFSPKVLLDELVRTACVVDLDNGYYRALTRSYVPEQLSAESIKRFANVMHNVTETLELNLRTSAQGGRRIERTVFADYGLPKEELGAFDKYIRERGQIFADDIDNWLQTRSMQGRDDVIQTGIGFYHYVVNEEDEREFGTALNIEGK
jgi:hypothetical protein